MQINPIPFKYLSNTCQIPFKYLSNTCQIPFKYLSNTFQIPVKYLSNTFQIPVKYLSNTFQIPFKYLPNTCQIPFKYLSNTCQIPFKYLSNTFQYLSNTCQTHCIYAIYGWKCSSKQYRIHWGMNGRSYVCKIKIHCTLKKTVPCEQFQTFFRNNYFGPHPFLMNFFFTKIFVHLPVIAAVYYFSVYELIGWDPANI